MNKWDIITLVGLFIVIMIISIGGIIYMNNDYKCAKQAQSLGYYGGYSLSKQECVIFEKVKHYNEQ